MDKENELKRSKKFLRMYRQMINKLEKELQEVCENASRIERMAKEIEEKLLKSIFEERHQAKASLI